MHGNARVTCLIKLLCSKPLVAPQVVCVVSRVAVCDEMHFRDTPRVF